jgi:hypothetical protein
MTWLWHSLTASMAVNGMRLRHRIQGLPVLEATIESVDPTHRFITATGVRLDDATARAASRYVRRHQLEALDLVPADLPVERLLDVVRYVDPHTYAGDPLAPGRGGGQALLVTADLVRRAHLDLASGLDAVDFLHLTENVKRHAPRATGIALAPDLVAGPDEIRSNLAYLRAMFSVISPVVVAIIGAELALLSTGALRRRRGALMAAAAYTVQPGLAVLGTAARPRDRRVRSVFRLPLACGELIRMVGRPDHRTAAADGRAGTELARRRRDYDRLLAHGTEPFFESRRPDCPLCGSRRLSVRLRTGDLLQCKPGVFSLEGCEACGHIFQNPRLSPEGLEFYYRDFYDGDGGDQIEKMFRVRNRSYRGRAEMIEGVAHPKHWLDVGTGDGHFCLAARSTWPTTVFDGLDLGVSVERGERRGWIRRGYRGLFPEYAEMLAGRYDVVSMHHYLEHTRDPGAELDAAAEVLGTDGLLLIELPDPQSRLGRRLGRWWGPWFQPQHQHLLTLDNLKTMLAMKGFQVVAEQRQQAHQPCDLVFALLLVVNRIAPPTDVPWRPEPSRWARVRRVLAVGAAAPLLVMAAVLDRVLAPVLSRGGSSNSFRVLARRPVEVYGRSTGLRLIGSTVVHRALTGERIGVVQGGVAAIL